MHDKARTDLQDEKDEKENIIDPFLWLEPPVLKRRLLGLWVVLWLTD